MYDIGFDTALECALANVEPVGRESVRTSEIVGRVCAEDVVALIDYPSSNSSLKDGYALVSGDVARACVSDPVGLSVVGTIGAGDESTVAVTSGCAVRVLSGAPIPEGANAVLAEEFAEVGPSTIKALACAEPGRNILFRGSEISKGETLVRTGQVFSPARVSLVVAGGLYRATVFRRPVVGLLATGNGVLLPGEAVEPGKLFASNLALQEAWLRSLSIRTTVRRAGDSFKELMATVDSMLSDCDVLITSGGAL
jgi:molybdopterin molybdotransferase